MRNRPRPFWDSSAIIDAIYAPDESPFHDLLDLGESAVVDMRVSPDVIREVQNVLGRRDALLVADLAEVLSYARFATTPAPSVETVDYCVQLTGYRNDARILAAAEGCLADILVSHDKQHLLGNPLIGPPDTHCRVRSVEDALQWCLGVIRSDEPELT